jgi:hypothetical protein
MMRLLASVLFGVILGIGSAQAAPAQLYGKTIKLSWTESRDQRREGQTDWHGFSRGWYLTIYVSPTGRLFHRLQVSGGLQQETSDRVTGDGGSTGRVVEFRGNRLEVFAPITGGMRHTVVDFDPAFGSCSLKVSFPKEVTGGQMMSIRTSDGRSVEVRNLSAGEGKADQLRKQLEDQSARQMAEAKQKISEQAKKELDEARQKLAEQSKKELDEAKARIEQSQQQAEEARKQLDDIRRQAVADAQAQVGRARREAKEETERIASLPSAQVAPLASPPQIDAADIARLLQAHLKRVGCDPGNSDGSWDDGSRRALARFNQDARTSFDIKVASIDALDAVRNKKDRVCPLVCAKGQRVDGDRCVQIACDRRYFLNSNGECEKRAEPPPKPREVVNRDPQARSRAVIPSGGGKCFNFGGKTYCE